MRFSNIEEEDEEYYSSKVVHSFTVDMEMSHHEFAQHVTVCNQDFKESIIKQVQTIKLKDTSELNKSVSILSLILFYFRLRKLKGKRLKSSIN
jgi:hypothetical protein